MTKCLRCEGPPHRFVPGDRIRVLRPTYFGVREGTVTEVDPVNGLIRARMDRAGPNATIAEKATGGYVAGWWLNEIGHAEDNEPLQEPYWKTGEDPYLPRRG